MPSSSVEHIVRLFLIQVQQHFSIRARLEAVSRFQPAPQVQVIVDLAIEGDGQVAAFVRHGLCAAGDIDNRQTNMAQNGRTQRQASVAHRARGARSRSASHPPFPRPSVLGLRQCRTSVGPLPCNGKPFGGRKRMALVVYYFHGTADQASVPPHGLRELVPAFPQVGNGQEAAGQHLIESVGVTGVRRSWRRWPAAPSRASVSSSRFARPLPDGWSCRPLRPSVAAGGTAPTRGG